MKPLYRTIIVIWSEYDPTNELELEELARAATNGDAYCSVQESVKVDNPEDDPHWDNNTFFDDPTEDEEEVG